MEESKRKEQTNLDSPPKIPNILNFSKTQSKANQKVS